MAHRHWQRTSPVGGRPGPARLLDIAKSCGKTDPARCAQPVSNHAAILCIDSHPTGAPWCVRTGAAGVLAVGCCPIHKENGRRCGVATMWPELCVGDRSTAIQDEG